MKLELCRTCEYYKGDFYVDEDCLCKKDWCSLFDHSERWSSCLMLLEGSIYSVPEWCPYSGKGKSE